MVQYIGASLLSDSLTQSLLMVYEGLVVVYRILLPTSGPLVDC